MQQKFDVNINSKNDAINYQIYLSSMVFIDNSALYVYRTNDRYMQNVEITI